MARHALEVADIFRARAGHVGQLKVMAAIERCRTAALGGPRRPCRGLRGL